MKKKNFILALAVLTAVSFSGVAELAAQDAKMKYEDYLIELQQWKDREDAANAQIATLQSEINALRQRLSDLDRQIADTRASTFRAMNSSRQAFQQYLNQLRSLRDQMRGLLNLSASAMVGQENEIGNLSGRVGDLKGRGEAKHPDSKTLLSEIDNLLSRLTAALARSKAAMGPKFDLYTVNRGDHLWGIARKPETYGDPFRWMQIYTQNREMISNPDLIYPNQQFKIFRSLARNEYQVVRGDFLYRIAGKPEVYGDPFKWTMIYEANKGVIKDANIIYPHMVLIFPNR